MVRNRKGRYNALVLVIIYIYLELSVLVNGKTYPAIQWFAQNPRFKEGTFRLNVLPNSKVTIICPHLATSLATADDSVPTDQRFENFWIVDNSSYHQCNVNTSISNNRKLLTCSEPWKLHFETLVFKAFNVDRVAVFPPGKTYFFISTSTGYKVSLDSTSNGHCKTANMKMQVYVCKNSQDVHCSDVKPTTPVIASFAGIRIKTTTSTVSTKKVTAKLNSGTPQTSTKTTTSTVSTKKVTAKLNSGTPQTSTKTTTSTVSTKKVTAKLNSGTPQTSTKVAQETTTPCKEPPVEGKHKKENDEASSMNGRFSKVNSSPVCFGSKNNEFGNFSLPSTGGLVAIKLVHLYGYVACYSNAKWSLWGCGGPRVNVVITSSTNDAILPPAEFSSSGNWATIPGYTSLSPELVLSVFSRPHPVTSGEEFRLWYGEDLVDSGESDNLERVCSNVYILFI